MMTPSESTSATSTLVAPLPISKAAKVRSAFRGVVRAKSVLSTPSSRPRTSVPDMRAAPETKRSRNVASIAMAVQPGTGLGSVGSVVGARVESAACIRRSTRVVRSRACCVVWV